MKISIYGCGYVGLVTGLCLANIGNDVLCYDVDSSKIDNLMCGDPIIHEKDIDALLISSLESRIIDFTDDIQKIVAFSDVHIIAVPTPSNPDGSADLSAVFSAVEAISEHVESPFLLIIKSTVPVGTCQKVKNFLEALLIKKKSKIPFEIAFLPEFFQQGSAIEHFMQADRIVVGTESEEAYNKIYEIFASLLRKIKAPVVKISLQSAELSKYTSNAFLATKISFINEISNIAEATGADIIEVKEALKHDTRIGNYLANPGCGFGGSCLPKDIKALISTAGEYGIEADVLKATYSVNCKQKKMIFEKLNNFYHDDLAGKTVALWGLSFKPNTDDIREAISIDVISLLLEAKVKIQAYDPVSMEKMKHKFPPSVDLIYCKTKENALLGADALIVVTEWPEFYNIDLNEFKQLMKTPVIFDGRNIFNIEEMNQNNITYYGVGCKQP